MDYSTEDWGLVAYEEAYQRQTDYVQQRIDGDIANTLIFVEHPPVYTLGKRKDTNQNLIWNQQLCLEKGISVVQTNRGGDVTYHGPGQCIGYPIIDLSRKRDLHAYLRDLEQVVICTLAYFGLQAERRSGKTGIWLENRKIAAIGVAVRRWVTYHGFALNVNNDLAPFTGIIPCGIPLEEGTVTSLKDELGRSVALVDVKRSLREQFWEIFKSY